MASFEDPVQDIKPDNYIYWAQRTQAPKVDVSGETRFATVGKGLTEAGQTIDEAAQSQFKTTEQRMKGEMQTQFDSDTKQWLGSLSRIDDVLNKPDSERLIQDPSKLPPELQKLPGTVDGLIGIRDNGHVSPVHQDMLRDTMAKNLRTKYPGFRDQIDSEFSRLTREDPANKVAQQMMEDINAAAAARKTAHDAVRTKIIEGITTKDGAPLPPELLAQYDAGKITKDQAMGYIYKNNLHINAMKINQLETAQALQAHELTSKVAADKNTDYRNKEVANSVGNLEITIPGFASHNINGILTELQSGKELSDDQAQQVTRVLTGAMTAVGNRMRFAGTQPLDPDDKNSTTRSAAEGAEAYEKGINTALSPYQDMIRLFTDKDKFAYGYVVKNRVAAQQDAIGAQILKDHPEMGFMAQIEKWAGPNSKWATDYFTKNLINPALSDKLKPYSQDQMDKLLVQPDIQTKGVVFTMDDAIKESTRKGLNGPAYAGLNNGIISGAIWSLTNKDTPPQLRDGAIESLTNPKNQQFLENFTPSQVDQRGAVQPGRSTVLAETANPKVAVAIKKNGTPDQHEGYQEYVRKSVGIALKPEFDTLNKISRDPSIKIGFDTEKDRFFTRPTGVNIGLDQRANFSSDHMKDVDDATTKINLALRSFVDANKPFGKTDVKSFLLQFFETIGMDPKLAHDTLGGQFLEAVKTLNIEN